MPEGLGSFLAIVFGGSFLAFVQFLISRGDSKREKKEDTVGKIDDLRKDIEESNRNQKEAVSELSEQLQAVVSMVKDLTDQQGKQSDSLMGLDHDRICWLGNKYIQQGWISISDMDDFEKYLYRPYKGLGGNGTAEAVMEKLKKLPNEVQD